MSGVRTVVFAKAPFPGLAKTRLIPALGIEGAARLARQMLAHTLNEALSAEIGPVELCVTPSASDAAWQSTAAPDGVVWSEQGIGDLGARLARASARVIGAGESVLLIGADCPELGAIHLRRAARCLQETDSVVFPTADGGYALLGLNRFHPLLFERIPWSTDTVAFETLRRIDQLGWTVQSNPMLHDIDEPADLRWLPQDWRKMVAHA